MSENIKCPNCQSTDAYAMDNLMNCPSCFHEWDPSEVSELDSKDVLNVIDSNGNKLENGDSVMVLKDLPVKGSPRPIKAGTKVKNIRLAFGDHNIDCKIETFGAVAIKSEFVKKC